MSKTLRRLHMPDGRIVRYRIYESGTIVFFTPAKHVTDYAKVTGYSWDAVEKGCWKRWLHITPQVCKDYISKQIAGEQKP